MRLVIAEKHSVAVAIAQALGTPVERDGYIEPDDGVMVSWAQGHLVELADPEAYEGEAWASREWSMDTLPVDPHQWRWRVSGAKGASARFKRLVALIRDPGVDGLVNACDPDREGEAIFRRIVAGAHSGKPVLRLWVASLDGQAIRDAWARMRPDSAYDGLAAAADARAKADWLVGMNASRAHTLAWHRPLSLGRVRTPTLGMVVRRDEAIEHHTPTPFWRLAVHMGGWTLHSPRITDHDAAVRLLDAAQGRPVNVTRVERRREHDRPPALFDLTGLQQAMNTRYGVTAEHTLDALQHLYEMGLATYPRTDSRYITHDDLPALRLLLHPRYALGFLDTGQVTAIHDLAQAGVLDPARCVDDGKVAGHTAILPTGRLTYDTFTRDLTDTERQAVTTILTRMWAACSTDRVHDTTRVTAAIDTPAGDVPGHGIPLRASGDTPVTPGWTLIEHPATARDTPHGEHENSERRDEGDGTIPAGLVEGTYPQAGPATLAEGHTAPPRPFTEASLLAAMEHASRFVADRDLKAALDDDTSHSGGIGTPATRAGIIEQLVRTGNLERKGRQIHSTPAGRLLIAVAVDELKDVKLTAQWEQTLADIEHGDADPQTFLDQIRAECARLPRRTMRPAGRVDLRALADTTREKESYGPCPRCGAPVVRTGGIWQCSTNHSRKNPDGTWQLAEGCGYRIYPTICGRKLTDTAVRRALAGKHPKITGLVSKAGRKFDARLEPDPDRGIRLAFDDRPGGRRRPASGRQSGYHGYTDTTAKGRQQP